MPVTFLWDPIVRLGVLAGFVFSLVLVLIYMERKVLGHIQQRLGPMRTGFHGLLQTPADAIKLLVKEDIIPTSADKWVFRLAPAFVFVPIYMMFLTVPITRDIVVRNLDLGLFYLVAFSSLHIVGLLMAGWGSDNKYALLGGVRAAAQLISYELPLAFAILSVALLTGTLNLRLIVEAQYWVPLLLLQPLGLVIFLIASLAELGRTPFDIPMAESEVVGGPMVEYSGMRWALFFLAEYANLFVTAAVMNALFFGGWEWPFVWLTAYVNDQLYGFLGAVWFLVKTFVIIAVIFWLRGTLPRLRIDQLMSYAWKLLLPFSFVNLLITAAAVMFEPLLLTLGWAATGGFAYATYALTRRRG